MVGCSLIIAFILVAQLYWLKRVYNLEQHQFNESVLASVRGLFNDMDIEDETKQIKQVVETADQNTYLVKLASIPQKDSLLHYINNEFEDFNVWTDCNVAVFNKTRQGFEYQYYLPAAASRFPKAGNFSQLLVKKE